MDVSSTESAIDPDRARLHGRQRALEALLLLPITLALAVWIGSPTVWLLVPLGVITLTGRPYEQYGLGDGRKGSWKFHAIVAATVWGGYALAHYFVGTRVLGQSFHPRLPDDFIWMLVNQILVVGLCEEMYFRGYLQTHLNDWLGRPFRFLGASWGWGLIIAAILFGVCHLVEGDLTRMRVAFFGLFAGWLRERTDTVAIPAVYHGLSNCLYYFMLTSLS